MLTLTDNDWYSRVLDDDSLDSIRIKPCVNTIDEN